MEEREKRVGVSYKLNCINLGVATTLLRSKSCIPKFEPCSVKGNM
jgi:hypothetical protein